MKKMRDYQERHRNIGGVQWQDGRFAMTMVPTNWGIVVAVTIGPLESPRYTGQTSLYYSMGDYTHTRIINHPYSGEWLARRAKSFAEEKYKMELGGNDHARSQRS